MAKGCEIKLRLEPINTIRLVDIGNEAIIRQHFNFSL